MQSNKSNPPQDNRRMVCALSLIAWVLVSGSHVTAADEQTYHMKLLEHLGAETGYCLELLGRPGQEDLLQPLIAHGCKVALAPDDSILLTENGEIYFPALDRCVTAMGLGESVLEFNSLMVKECGVVEPYLNAPAFQRFEMNDRSQVQLVGTDLCMTAGDTARPTSNPTHVWRALYMQDCASAPPERSQWHLFTPPGRAE